MKRFKGFVIKEFYHILRDRRTMVILFGMPLVQILLFGFAITNEINNVAVAVLDKSNDSDTQRITNSIEASPYFILKEKLNNDSEIEAIFKSGSVKAVLIFESDFSAKLQRKGVGSVQIITDATEPNTANTITSYINAILQGDIQRRYGKNNRGVLVETQLRYNPELKSVYTFVPGVMTVILMLVSAMMTSISITREKELGTMEILLVSPMNPFMVIVGKVVPYIFLSVINAIIILLLGYFVFHMPINGSVFLLACESVLFILSALSLGILISTIANSQQTAMMMSLMGLMLPVIILSGFIFPISSMPLPLQVVSNIVPAKWFIIISKSILLKGVGLRYIWKETLVLIGMTLFFMLMSIRKYKIRLE